MPEKTSFILHHDSLNVLDELSDEQAGQLFKAIKRLRIEGIMPDEFWLKIAIKPFANQFIRDGQKYEKMCDKNRENGSTGGRPKKNPVGLLETEKTQSVIPKPKKPDSDSDNDSESDNESDKERKNILFSKFWELYGKKIDRHKCQLKWDKLEYSVCEKIIQAVPVYVAQTPDEKFRKNPLTFLNGQTWEDFQPPPPKPITLNPKHYWSDQDYVKALKQHGHDIPEHLRQYA